MHQCNCNTAPQWVSNPCWKCASSPPCSVPFSCDPCQTVGSSTPMTQCGDVDMCGEGCVETIRDTCVTHIGSLLPTIEAIPGDSLASVLLKINNILRVLANADANVPTYNYRLVCLTSALNGVTINTVTKNAAVQLMAPQTFGNAASALAYLQTLDANWSFTAPNLFHINSEDEWVVTMACP